MSDTPRENRDQTPNQGVGPGPGEGQRAQPGTTMHRETKEYTTEHRDITSHPDVAEMDARYARVLHSPRVSAVDGLIMLTGLYVAISPWVVHFQNNNTIMRTVDLILGLALAVIGFGMSTRPERRLGRLADRCLPDHQPLGRRCRPQRGIPGDLQQRLRRRCCVRSRASRDGPAALWTSEATRRPRDGATRGAARESLARL